MNPMAKQIFTHSDTSRCRRKWNGMENGETHTEFFTAKTHHCEQPLSTTPPISDQLLAERFQEFWCLIFILENIGISDAEIKMEAAED